MTTDSKVNPGSQTGDDTVTIILPMGFADHQRLTRACQTITDERGEPYSVHDLICDAVSLAVEDVEKGAGDADDATNEGAA